MFYFLNFKILVCLLCHCCLETHNGMWPAFNSKTGCERHKQARLFIDQGQSKPAKAYLNNHMSTPRSRDWGSRSSGTAVASRNMVKD